MRKNRKYLIVIDGNLQPDVTMTPRMAEKLREHSRCRVSTFTPSEGYRAS